MMVDGKFKLSRAYRERRATVVRQEPFTVPAEQLID
jgi:hypothetical protein